MVLLSPTSWTLHSNLGFRSVQRPLRASFAGAADCHIRLSDLATHCSELIAGGLRVPLTLVLCILAQRVSCATKFCCHLEVKPGPVPSWLQCGVLRVCSRLTLGKRFCRQAWLLFNEADNSLSKRSCFHTHLVCNSELIPFFSKLKLSVSLCFTCWFFFLTADLEKSTEL